MLKRTMLRRRCLLASAAALATSSAKGANPVIRLGVLNDQSGPYRDLSGQTSVACVRQAVQDFGQRGFDVEALAADHQNKPDVAAQTARGWLDRDAVDAIVDVPNSAAALAVSTIVTERNKVLLNCATGSAELTGPQCTRNMVHWSWDTYMLAKALAGPVTRAGGKRWYFIAANYVTGQQLARDAGRFAIEAGGQVVGTSTYPFPETTDFSSFLLDAQASGADVLGLANAGGDTISNLKQAIEFGVTPQMKVAALIMLIGDVRAVGLETAQRLLLTEGFYWDLNDRTRAFTARVRPKTPANMPCTTHASAYSATLHYLKALAELGVAAGRGGRNAVACMKAMPTDDDAFGKCSIRADGQVMLPAYIFEVKRPQESRAEWDYYKRLAVVAAEDAFRPLAEGGCPLVAH